MFTNEEPLAHVFELKEGKGGETNVKLIEDLEGLGVTHVVPGTANRFAFITKAGDAYILRGRTTRAELLEVDDESAVKHAGIGANFEVIVTESNVWVRGESEPVRPDCRSDRDADEADRFSQLGLGEGKEDNEDAFVKLSNVDGAERIEALHCARWSTILTMRDA